MHSIKELQDIINHRITATVYQEKPSELYEPVSYLMSLGGKRTRPVLVLLSAELFGGNIHNALDAAIGIELFHNFTLMHDDIMDRAPLRRGKPTVHARWNESAAILSGDVMLVEAYKMITRVNDHILRDVLEIFSDTASGVCQGQQADMNFEQRKQVSLDEYLSMIAQKTAVLLAGSMQIGALIGGADKEQSALLYEFGLNLGLAFQLQDDILDVYGDPGKFGKLVGGDIIANKKTFLLIKTMELLKGEQAEQFEHWLYGSHPSDLKVQAVTSVYNKLGIRGLAETQMQEYISRALKALEMIPVDHLRKEILRDFAGQLQLRQN